MRIGSGSLIFLRAGRPDPICTCPHWRPSSPTHTEGRPTRHILAPARWTGSSSGFAPRVSPDRRYAQATTRFARLASRSAPFAAPSTLPVGLRPSVGAHDPGSGCRRSTLRGPFASQTTPTGSPHAASGSLSDASRQTSLQAPGRVGHVAACDERPSADLQTILRSRPVRSDQGGPVPRRAPVGPVPPASPRRPEPPADPPNPQPCQPGCPAAGASRRVPNA